MISVSQSYTHLLISHIFWFGIRSPSSQQWLCSNARGPLDLWNEWATEILVLLSLALQVVLLLFAGIRRREASVVPTFVLWLAYQLADSTAIYAVGHLSLSSVAVKRQLVAFWAPFLLLHLGGPDNITAYALEDSKLWPRHLQNLVVQVLGAAYVLYKYVAAGNFFIFLAAVLMFAVGVVKYAERTWALKLSNLDSIRSSLKTEHVGYHQHFQPPDYGSTVANAVEGDEFYVRCAHSMFHICKRAIVDYSRVARAEKEDPADSQSSWEAKEPAESQSFVVEMDIKNEENNYKGMWTLIEMELSLMYDLLYTKAGVIHTWSGYGIRVASSVTAAASFMLFQFSSKDGHRRVDVALTYTLLAGACILETASVLRALGSSWTYGFLCNTRWSWLQYAALCTGRWDRLRWLVKAITGRRGREKASARRWSGKIGQYNMLHVCSRNNRAFDPLLGKMARMVGCQDWWIKYYYSGTVEFPQDLKERLFEYTKDLTSGSGLNMQGVIRKNWGELAFRSNKEKKLYDSLTERNNYLGVEFQEGIIIWHIATEVFIAKTRGGDADGAADDLVKDIRTLSNYIIFLLVDRPYMLPGLAQSMLYRQTCENVNDIIRKHNPDSKKIDIWTKLKDFFRVNDDPNAGWKHIDQVAKIIYKERPAPSHAVPRLYFSCRVAEQLCESETMNEKGRMGVLRLLLHVWMDFLVYAANRCSRESHAKKLGNGGEFTTILWLMTDFLLQAHNEAKEKSGG